MTVGGTYTYTSGRHGPRASGTPYSEDVTFTPTDAIDYNTVNTTVNVTVGQATPNVTVNAVALDSGTALDNSQLSGTATFVVNGTSVNVPGT